MKEIADILREWMRRRGQPLALATLVRAEGSSYRRPGARMLISPDGTSVGSLSGGCLEEEVARRALDVLRTGRPSLMNFDTRLRFGCHGSIEIFVEAVRENFLAEIAMAWEERRTCRAMTVLAGEEAELGSWILPSGQDASAGAFVQEIEPPIQLVIFGDGPDSAPLRSFAEILGWRVIQAEQVSDLPAHADERTAALVKSHNYGRDYAALQHFIRLDLRYVGLLGPRKRRDQLVNALLDAGVSIDAELFAPAGFDLGAETPEEIALAIISEIQTVFAAAGGEPLRDSKAPIHGWNLVRKSPSLDVEECETSAR